LCAPRGWLLLAAILTAISINALAPEDADGGHLVQWYVAALIVVIGTVISIILHDLAHHIVARRNGTHLRFSNISLVGALSDEAYAPVSPSNEVRVATAGPTLSLLLGLMLGGVWLLRFDHHLITGVFGALSLINVSIAIGTMLPGYPLDGGRVLRSFLWFITGDLIVATRIVAIYGQVIGVGAVLGGLLFVALGEPLAVWGVWALLSFWTINQAGRAGYQRTIWRETGSKLLIDEAGLAFSRRIQSDRTIDDALDDLLSVSWSGPILVQQNGEIVGVVGIDQVRHVPRAIWDQTTIRDIQVPLEPYPRMPHDARILDLLDLFEQENNINLVVIEMRGRVVGAVDRPTTHARLQEYLRRAPAAQDHHRID
jgi:Zn-dependent protease